MLLLPSVQSMEVLRQWADRRHDLAFSQAELGGLRDVAYITCPGKLECKLKDRLRSKRHLAVVRTFTSVFIPYEGAVLFFSFSSLNAGTDGCLSSIVVSSY
jgi:hypothetical protein